MNPIHRTIICVLAILCWGVLVDWMDGPSEVESAQMAADDLQDAKHAAQVAAKE